MEIIWKKRVKTDHDGEFDLQLEDWSKSYDNTPKSSTLAAYPVAKHDGDGYFAPKAGNVFRWDMWFGSRWEAEVAAKCIEAGMSLKRYSDKLWNKEYAVCL